MVAAGKHLSVAERKNTSEKILDLDQLHFVPVQKLVKWDPVRESDFPRSRSVSDCQGSELLFYNVGLESVSCSGQVGSEAADKMSAALRKHSKQLEACGPERGCRRPDSSRLGEFPFRYSVVPLQ